MKHAGWILGALVAAGVGFSIRGGCLNSEPAPDERLAGHFDKMMCGIARDNIETPERGVRKLGHYLDRHVGDMFKDFGEMFATIERIADDSKHDKRAEQARDRLRKTVIKCARDWNRFGEAVGNDPKAVELLERFNERLGRTIEIIFGEGRQLDVLRLPEQMTGVTFAPR